jgi:hypothetical protein
VRSRRGDASIGYLIVVEIPVDEAADALLDGSARPITDVVHEVLHVRPGIGYVSGLERHEILLCLSAETLL